jgi:hypothetical protein
MKALGSCNRVWNLGKRGYIWLVGHNATSFLPVTVAKLTRFLRRDLEIEGAYGGLYMVFFG